jgi:hypothetical protein
MKANILFHILKNKFFKNGELLRFANPETQRAYSSDFRVSMQKGNGCVSQYVYCLFT